MRNSTPPRLGDLSWRTARRCDGGNCVRIAASGDMIIIGDSKSPDGPVLAYNKDEWTAFVEGIRQGDFDSLA